MKEIKTSVDDIYKRLFRGEKEYGESKEEIKLIVDLFNNITKKSITEDEYFIIMILTKLVRDGKGIKKLDNVLDVAGYSILWYKQRKFNYLEKKKQSKRFQS